MHQQSLSLYEFQQRFPDEQTCQDHLFQLRWPQGFCCPRCSSHDYYTITTRGLYECAHCHYQSSVTAGTLFHRTRTPLHVWLWVICLVAKAFIAGTYHGIGPKHLGAYLTEFCYRFNRRFWQNQLFDRLLYAGVHGKPITYTELTL